MHLRSLEVAASYFLSFLLEEMRGPWVGSCSNHRHPHRGVLITSKRLNRWDIMHEAAKKTNHKSALLSGNERCDDTTPITCPQRHPKSEAAVRSHPPWSRAPARENDLFLKPFASPDWLKDQPRVITITRKPRDSELGVSAVKDRHSSYSRLLICG